MTWVSFAGSCKVQMRYRIFTKLQDGIWIPNSTCLSEGLPHKPNGRQCFAPLIIHKQ